jgi:hypothetical protein
LVLGSRLDILALKKSSPAILVGGPQPKPVSTATLLAEELQSTVSVTENGRRVKADKHRLLVKQSLNKAITGDFRPLMSLLKNSDILERLAKTPTKMHPRVEVDLTKLSLEEKLKMLKEAIANSKPVDEY